MRPEQRRPGYFEALPAPRRSPREVNVRAGLVTLLMAPLLGLVFLAPLIMSAGIINHVPPLARFYCPESGKIALVPYSPSSSNHFVPYACLDLGGKRIESPATHRLIRWSVTGAVIAILAPVVFTAARFAIRNKGRRKRP